MKRRSAAFLKISLALLLTGATFLMTGQSARAVSCSTKGCIPAYQQCLAHCATLAPSAQPACRVSCQQQEEDCFDICE